MISSVVVAGQSLRLPDGLGAQVLGDEATAPSVEAFVTASLDHTVYHLRPYIEFARRENGAADLLLITSHGQPQFALPFHPEKGGVTTGYAGVCFPPSGDESVLHRAFATLDAIARANRLRISALQAAQAAAIDDHRRSVLMAYLIDSMNLRHERLYTRLLRLAPTQGGSRVSGVRITLDSLPDSLLGGYDADVRNQIRQASRKGVTAQVVVPDQADEAATAYATYLPIHRASWQRTGLSPHPLEYLLGLEEAVRRGGGHDVIVFAAAPSGEAVAAVTCHVYGDRAIYWSGCSLPEALPLRANPFCLHVAICAVQQLGVRTFELGRFRAVEPNRKELDLTRYKAQFGGDVVPVLNFEVGPRPVVQIPQAVRTARSRVGRMLRRRRDTTSGRRD